MDGMEDLLAEFVTDTQEALENVDVRLVELEGGSDAAAILHDLFRMMHTIKGTCGFLGLPRMAGLAHHAETLMDQLRNGAPITHEAVDVMLRVVDRLRLILAHIETSGGAEPDGEDEELIGALQDASQPSDEAPAEPAVTGPAAAEGAGVQEFAEGGSESPAAIGLIDALPDELPPSPRPERQSRPSAASNSPPAPPATKAAASTADRTTPSERADGAEQAGDRSIRVAVETLEHLMTVVSELVLTRNELTEIMRNQEGTNHKLALQRLSTVTGELQQAVMSTRMQPIGNAWRKLPRIVRDVAAKLGKSIELDMHGANTELDRQVLESIKDPLVHMVRNAADHGLETRDEREALGKPAKGTIRLNAYHEGGQILVEIADDGRGLDVERIKAKAIERGITTPEEAERLSDEQVFSFIFEPGFSTAQGVTRVSGRGVGMDVVQSNVERIGGYIDVRSAPGVGSVFTLKIPLTLAIMRALIVGVGKEEFAIAQTSVDELLKVEPGGAHVIKLIKDSPVLRSRDRLLPVVDLSTVLKQPGAFDCAGQPIRTDEATSGFVMVMRARGMQFGMLVDTVLRTEEIVVKPLPSALRGLDIFSGSTILGDGRVIMIVDPNGVRSAVANTNDAITSVTKKLLEVEEDRSDTQLLLIFRAATANRKALPISLITRLEEIALADANQSNGAWHMKYHDELIPLVWFGGGPDAACAQRKPILVMSDAGRSMGLLVDEIVDIVSDRVEIQIPSEREGILGSAIIGGKTTEMIDVTHFLGLASTNWFEPNTRARRTGEIILLVDDSPFFRNLIAPVVRSAGYEPILCASGSTALERLDAGLRPAVIVTDVDMPGMNGFRFGRAVREREQLRNTPVIALTGLVNEDAIAEARRAGFADYISKLDRNGLLSALREFAKPGAKELAA